MNIIDEDICAKCSRLIGDKPEHKPWDIEAECEQHFPITKIFMNVISECAEFTPIAKD